jgi:tetratricopeptide (TPR) repeat protein
LEGRLIESKAARPVRKGRSGPPPYLKWILAAVGVLLVAGGAVLYRAQEKAKRYDEAFKKGSAAWTRGDAEAAVAQFRKAAQIDGEDPELWVQIGRSELVLRHDDRASEAWEEALKRSPGYKPALFERGKEAFGRHVTRRIPPPVDGETGWLSPRLEAAARGEGGAEEAKRILSDLRESSEQNPAFTKFTRGAIYLLDGKYAEAPQGFQEYSELNPWDTTGIAMLGIATFYATLPSRAERALSEALTRRNEKAWLKLRADARYLQANYAGARQDYKDAGLEKEAEPLFARRLPSQGMILWLRADAGVDASGSTVTKWQDQSSGKHDAAPKDPAIGPQLSAVRGHPAILFAGKEDDLHLPDGFEEFGAGLSMFVVGEPMTEPADEWSFLLLATPARGAGRIEALLGRRRESEQIVYSVEDLEKQTRPFVPGVPPAKEFESFGAIQDPSGAARVFKRGALAGEGKLLLPRKILRTRNRVGAGLKGHVAEIILYNRSLSEMERQGVDAYLKDRYFPDAPPAEKR